MKRCVLSFFDDTYQREIKERCFGASAFEETLRKYRDLFLSELETLGNIDTLGKCAMCQECLFDDSALKDYEIFLNDFWQDIQGKKDYIKILFDEVINIYTAAIAVNRSTAMQKMQRFITDRCDDFSVLGAMPFAEPMFRAREKGNYNGNEIHELYHVPFDKRYCIGNQRFSLTGIPLLYLAESLPLALREIGCEIRKANAAVFLPKYSNYYRKGVYDISNPIIYNLLIIGRHMMAGSMIKYDQKIGASFNKYDIDQYLARFVLSQIFHFPVQERFAGSFIQEYVLPQLLMDVVNTKQWIGIEYQSCKKINGEKRNDFKQFVDKNLCMNIPYKQSKYNEQMLDDFYYATWCSGEDTISFSNFRDKLQEITKLKDEALADGYNMNDYITYIVKIEMHVEKMIDAVGKTQYYRRKACRVEMTLLYKLLEVIEPVIANPGRYGIIKTSEIRNYYFR